MRIWKVRTL